MLFRSWMMTAFKLLAKMKRLRGTPLDIFGHTAERRMERQLIADYRTLIERLIATPQLAGSGIALELAALPDMIRGFGHVKERHIKAAKAEEAALLEQYRNGGARLKMAAE